MSLAGRRGGQPRPAILYGIDTRAEREIEELNERYGEENLLERCGSVLTTQAVGPKLLWLRRNEPEVWEKTRKFFMANSFIAWRLTGEYVLDHHSASQCDPLYDVREYRWIAEWAEEIAPGLPLPRLLWPAEVVGEVTREASEATGIPAGTPVAAGTIDAWSEGASVGVQDRRSDAHVRHDDVHDRGAKEPLPTPASGARRVSCRTPTTWRPGWRRLGP